MCDDLRHLREREVSHDFIDRYMNDSIDAGYNQAVLDGSWPNAIEVLEHALQQAKENK
jgi:hypothetical protein